MTRVLLIAVITAFLLPLPASAQLSFDGVPDECEIQLRQVRVVDANHLLLHVSVGLHDRNILTNRYAPVSVNGFLVDVGFSADREPALSAQGPIWQDHSGESRQERRFPYWGSLGEYECYFLTPCGDLLHFFDQGPVGNRRLSYKKFDPISKLWDRKASDAAFIGIQWGAHSPDRRYHVGRDRSDDRVCRVVDCCKLTNEIDSWLANTAAEAFALKDPDDECVYFTKERSWCLQNTRFEREGQDLRYRREWRVLRRDAATPTCILETDGNEFVLAVVERGPNAVSVISRLIGAERHGNRIYDIDRDGMTQVTDFLGSEDLLLRHSSLAWGGIDAGNAVVYAIDDDPDFLLSSKPFEPMLRLDVRRCALSTRQTISYKMALETLFDISVDGVKLRKPAMP